MDFLDALFDKNSLDNNHEYSLKSFDKNQGITNLDINGMHINLYGDINHDKYPKFIPGNIPIKEIPERVEKLAKINDTARFKLKNIELMLQAAFEASKNQKNSKKSNYAFLKIKESVQDLLRRKVLFIGAENENKSKINVEGEFDFLKILSENKRIGLKRVKPASIKNIFGIWDEFRPGIVFFSCHGQETSLFLEDDNGNSKEIPAIELKKFFYERSEYTECVILSACSSSKIGHLLKDSCKNIIATTENVDIKTAREFTDCFFSYIERNSDSLSVIYENAHKHAIKLIQSLGLPNSYSFEFYKADKKM